MKKISAFFITLLLVMNATPLHAMALKPSVDTNTASYTDQNLIKAEALILNSGNTPVYEKGFVVSSTNPFPTVADDRKVVSGSEFKYSTSFVVSPSSSVYYVRAYAVNQAGIGYGQIITVYAHAMKTESAKNITNRSAEVPINLFNYGSFYINATGVIYSSLSSTPTFIMGETSYVYNESSSFPCDVKLTDLEPNTRYYARAFSKISDQYYYGNIIQFTTGSYTPVSTDLVTDLTGNSAVAVGTVLSGAENIARKGFIYSKSESTLTVETGTMAEVTEDVAKSGEYRSELSALTTDTSYFIRAFAIHNNGTVSYGVIKSFKTPYTVTINVFYKYDGNVIAEQKIESYINQALEANSLKPPAGYTLVDPNWRMTATTTTYEIELKHNESPFAYQMGDNLFVPDRAVTRGQVAEMIYGLAEDKVIGNVKKFTDEATFSNRRNAINFATSKGHMTGYEDGSFKQDKSMTRAELAVVLTRVFELREYGEGTIFKDTDGHWASQFINSVALSGFIDAFPDENFRPDASATRAEAVSMFSVLAHRTLLPLSEGSFKDVPESHWAYKYIMNAAVPAK